MSKLTTLESVIKWGLMNGFEVNFLPFEFNKSAIRCRFVFLGGGRQTSYEVTAQTYDELFKRVDYGAREIFAKLKMRHPGGDE